MDLHQLRPAKGASKNNRRRGRGPGSGRGKTAGRGHKGQRSRSGGRVRPGFEGGQMPLQRRIPTRGFTNRFRKEWTVVNVESLNRFPEGTEVTPELLLESGVVSNLGHGIKVLGRGDLDRPLKVRVHALSKTAADKIEAAGGTVEVI